MRRLLEVPQPFSNHNGVLYRFDCDVLSSAAATPPPARGLHLSRPVPNPASGNTRLMLTMETSARVAVSVFDTLGRRVQTLFSGVLPGREIHLVLDTAHLPGGMYFIRASSEMVQVEEQVTVLR